jgi:hypothetical protein
MANSLKRLVGVRGNGEVASGGQRALPFGIPSWKEDVTTGGYWSL